MEAPSFTVQIPGQAEPLTFNSAEDVADFFDQESARWVDFNKRVSEIAELPPQIKNITAQANKQWRNNANSMRSVLDSAGPDVNANLKHLIATFAGQVDARRLFYTASLPGVRIHHLAETNITGAAYLHAMYTGSELAALLGPSDPNAIADFLRNLPALVHAITNESTIESALGAATASAAQTEAAQKRAEQIEKRLDSLLNEQSLRAAEALKKSIEIGNTSLQELDARGNTQRDEISAAWESLKSTLYKAIKLRAPRTYWEQKARDHLRAAKIWAALFFVSLVLGIIGPLYLTPLLVTSLKSSIENTSRTVSHKGTTTPSKAASVTVPAVPASTTPSNSWALTLTGVGVPLFIALWLARITSRQISEHLLRQEDALERSVMIDTYLALNSSETGEALAGIEANFPLILSAIFRAGPGLKSDDSPPLGALDAAYRTMRGGSKP